MPYIDQNRRKELNSLVSKAIGEFTINGVTPGDLNYIITKMVHAYIDYKGLNYTHLNDVVGVLESAKAEFQRRVVAPYEDAKIAENGDV